MIRFLKTFLLVFIKQVIFLIVFGCAVSINGDGIFFIPTTLLIIYLVFYFSYHKKIYTKMKSGKSLLNLYYFVSWIIMSIFITYLILTESWLWNILPATGGLFSGLEYILVPILLVTYLIVWSIIIIGIYIFLKLSGNKNTKIY